MTGRAGGEEGNEAEVLGRGRHLRLLRRRGWELVERVGISGIVAVVALTDDGELLLVEQYREPVRGRVVELPAGLAGDEAGREGEDLESAARRELLEETGFEAARFDVLAEGPPSAGLTSELVTILRGWDLAARGPGGGAGEEEISVHRVPVDRVDEWLGDRVARGVLVDPKVWAGLRLAGLPDPRRR